MSLLYKACGFFYWVGLTHYVNLLFLGFLIRSGLEILSAHPKLYWRDDCRPGSEWLKFTKKTQPRDRLWTGTDEEESFSPWLALPGRRNLGLGRQWHFFCVIFWVLNGLLYAALLFATGEWRRLIPTSWSVFPSAARTAWIYLHFHLPPPGHPYNPLQQLTYGAVVFLLAPLIIATGAGMSPAVEGRFPGYVRLFGGRQAARSLHFLALLAVCAFTVGHVALVLIDHFPRNMSWIIHGRPGSGPLSIGIGLSGLAAAAALHVLATKSSLREPRRVKRVLERFVDPAQSALLDGLASRQFYSERDISPFFRVNGYPPEAPEYRALTDSDFKEWRLQVRGLVENPLELSLRELRAMPAVTQITKHNCIQGWSAVGRWTGVSLAELLKLCKPFAAARYALFRAFDEPRNGCAYYETIDMRLAREPQTILAYEMNGEPLTVPHGAPCRLRVESQLGFKMVKYLRSIEIISDYRKIGDGAGGYREDTQFYSQQAGI